MKAKGESLYGAWIVYILQCSDGSFYTGVTVNLKKRLMDHNDGVASKYTRSRRPVQLLVSSCGMDKREALRLEMKIKKMHRTKKVGFLKSTCPDIQELSQPTFTG